MACVVCNVVVDDVDAWPCCFCDKRMCSECASGRCPSKCHQRDSNNIEAWCGDCVDAASDCGLCGEIFCAWCISVGELKQCSECPELACRSCTRQCSNCNVVLCDDCFELHGPCGVTLEEEEEDSEEDDRPSKLIIVDSDCESDTDLTCHENFEPPIIHSHALHLDDW